MIGAQRITGDRNCDTLDTLVDRKLAEQPAACMVVVSPGLANDYPKLGVWDDGTTGSTGQSAYTFTTRDFPVGATFAGSGVMERDQMLVGGAITQRDIAVLVLGD